ncbi:MAG: fluoride efflux transporter CrcB [Planctomycetes bacterium]|nr:fluoride efflux transporter CrcB [Planctomycetota bacterium]
MLETLWIGLGGILGSIARFWLSWFVHQFLGTDFPYGTLLVNITGCFYAGFIGTMAEERYLFSSHTRMFLLIGVLGSFTTFSSFGYETLELFKEGSFLRASLNVGGNVFFCLSSIWLGSIASRLL